MNRVRRLFVIPERKEEDVSEYPEHEKLKAISHYSQRIGEFLEWCSYEKGFSLCFMNGDDYHPINILPNDLLAEFFEIDKWKLEDEKRAMLDELRKK